MMFSICERKDAGTCSEGESGQEEGGRKRMGGREGGGFPAHS